MRATYTHQIYDLSKSFSPTDVVALHHADVIVLVAQLELTSLRNVVRILMTLEGELSNKVKIVLNRVGTENDIPLQKAEETTGKPIFWQVPNDVKTMDEARNHGVPLLTGAPKSKIHQCILGLARALCGRETKPIPDKPSSRWSALFTRR
jgi:pilus assembly protein CpaE